MKPAPSGSGVRAFAFGALLLVLVLAPLPLGGNRPWALSLLAVLLWSGVLALALPALAAGAGAGGLAPSGAAGWLRPTGRGLRAAAWPLGLLAALALLLLLQVLAAGWGGTSPGSQDVFKTQHHLLRTLLYAGAFGLTVALVNDERRLRWLLLVLVGTGVVQAFLAVALNSAGAQYALFFTEFRQGGRANGSFPNPDHLAGYMELCLSAGLGWLVAQFGGGGAPLKTWRERLLAGLQFVMSTKMLLRLMLVVMVIALVMTHSRMGNGAFFIALLLVGALVAWRSPVLRRPALWLVLSMVLVDIFIIGQWVGLEKVVTRLQGTQLGLRQPAEANDPFTALAPPPNRQETLEERLRAPRAALALVADAPLLGHGGGTFYTAFPPFKTDDVIPYHFNHAHNDYVQQAADVGLLGLALWLGVGVAAGWRALRLLGPGQPRLSRGVAVATLMALVCLGLHSLVDFNLQIPANALTFSVLLALPFTLRIQPATAAGQRGRASSDTAWPASTRALDTESPASHHEA